jgi:hypothetical protein
VILRGGSILKTRFVRAEHLFTVNLDIGSGVDPVAVFVCGVIYKLASLTSIVDLHYKIEPSYPP